MMRYFKSYLRKSHFVLLILVIYSILKITISKEFWGSKKSDLTLLCFNTDRNKGDLDALAKYKNIKIIKFPIDIQQKITSPFLQPLRDNVFKDNLWHEIKNNEEVNLTKKLLIIYLAKYIKLLKLFINFDIIMTCSFYYWHDKCWEEAAPKVNVPYVVLHKECNKDPAIFDKAVKSYKKRGFKFNGTAIIVYNNLERDCLVASNVCNFEKFMY